MTLVWDGVTDDSACLQDLVNNAVAAGCPLVLPSGTGLINSPISVSGTTRILGQGRNLTTVKVGGVTGFAVNTNAPVEFEGFALTGSGTHTGISVTAPSGTMNCNSLFRDLLFSNLYIGIDFQNAANWTVNRCEFVFGTGWAGLQVANSANVDAGDSCVSDITYWAVGNANAIGIVQRSSGGLKISNSKFVGGAWGILLDLAANAHTSDLLIGNCSLENQTSAAIGLLADVPQGAFGNLLIHGCQFASPKAIWKIDNTAWLSQVNVKGCTGTAGKITLTGAVNTDLTGNL